jgi:hypothetical protein
VTAGKCETLIAGALVSRFYYVHAINYDRGGVWAGNASMCASDKVFTIKGIEDCVARGYEETRFFEVDTAEQKSWTVQLTNANKQLPKATPQLSPGLEAAAPLDRRVALVIGNSAYQNVALLTNPINDANLISDALKADGFTVTISNDLDREGFIKELRAFATADTAEWAVVYFAGHGMEVGGTNYLIPVDAKLLSDRDIDFEAVSLKQVMSEIDGARSLRVVILDACRNNPFETNMKLTNGEGRDVSRGLARIEPGRGTVVFYSGGRRRR